MLREAILAFSTAGAVYAWLCAVAAPLVGSGRSVLRHFSVGAWEAFALASAGAILWAVVASAAIVLALTLEPAAGLALLGNAPLWPGVLMGAGFWAVQLALTSRLPRVGRELEIATALAIVGIVRDDEPTLARAERWYVDEAIDPPQKAASAAPCRVAV
jgi:hypothetical protein